jgi:glycosyltransferase involved in cell wall biosynthesis
MAGDLHAPEVSVIVIFKDAEPFLEAAIASVCAQTFADWELLLVDDGSTDASTAIARQHAGLNGGRVRYLEHADHANRGMSATRNLGIGHARGEFIAFLDADDELVPNALDDQVAVLRAHPRVGMVYGPLEYWYGWTGDPRDQARDFVHPIGIPADRIYEPPSLIAHFVQNIGFSPAGILVRRVLLERVGGYEESFRGLYEDQVLAAKLCRAAPVFASGRCWYRYRQHPGSCCLSAQREGRLESSRRLFLRWLVGYLEEQGLAGSQAWREARKELRHSSRSRRLLARVAGARRLVWQRVAPAGDGGAGR